MAIFKRISARRGNQVDLNVSFYRGGQLADPYAIRKLEIYKTSVNESNKVVEIILDSPCDTTGSYPSPIEQVTADTPAGNCGTGVLEGEAVTGKYHYLWDVPVDAVAPDVYFDVWTWLPVNPCSLDDFDGSTNCDGDCYSDLDDTDLSSLLQRCCNKFWVYEDQWVCSDGLESVNFGFEPLNQKFRLPEVRHLEVGLMPLPLYDYNFNLVAPMIPNLSATICVETMHGELLVDDVDMEIGIRQGSYRTNPFVLRYLLRTGNFLIGSYKYKITITMPDGTTRTSPSFVLTVS